MRPRTRVAILILMTIGGILPLSVYFTIPSAHGMVRFSSYSELERFLLTRSSCSYGYGNGYNHQLQLYGGPATYGPAFPGASSLGAATTTTVSSAPSHSETNNQVSGVDELDTVKTDGQYIYTVTNNTVAIVDAYPVTSAQLVSRISLPNQTIDGIFVDGNNLSIISEAPQNPYSNNFYCGLRTLATQQLSLGGCYCYGSSQVQNTSISVYALTSHSSPTLKTTVTVNGTFVGARRIVDFVYLVASTPARYNQTLPVTVYNGKAIETPATAIYHSDVSDAAFSYTTVVAVNANQDSSTPTVETFMLGTSSTIFVSLTNIFLTQPTWVQQEETVIHRISIANSSIAYESTGTVPGHVLNQFSMDEYNGYLRVATAGSGWSQTPTSVYVLSQSMKIVGALENLSPGETFHAARFIGDRGYLVTFKRQDPLFVLNMQDPSSPTLMGQLNVTGVSDYLQPYDSGHLIGIGQSAQDVAWEDAARFTGLKISLFDVSNPNNPSDLSDFTIGDQGTYSPALTDQKAILFDKSLNLLVLPIDVYGQSSAGAFPAGYSGYYQGAFVFQVTVQGGIVFRGSITQFPSGQQYSYVSSALDITRSLYIGNTLYTISNAMIKMNSLSDLSDQGFVSLV
jgi:inhibitor of cysteine peptidase